MFTNDIDQAIHCLRELQSERGILFLERASELLIDTYQQGNKVIVAGNGGSLCDAMHFAEELTGFFQRRRPALPAISLTDPGHITCVGNDLGFDEIFARGVEAHGNPGDLFIALTTSGNSPNLIKAIDRAKSLSLSTIAFLGKRGGALRGKADLEWIVEGAETSDRIQEVHMTVIHMLIKQLEETLFASPEAQQISHAVLL